MNLIYGSMFWEGRFTWKGHQKNNGRVETPAEDNFFIIIYIENKKIPSNQINSFIYISLGIDLKYFVKQCNKLNVGMTMG